MRVRRGPPAGDPAAGADAPHIRVGILLYDGFSLLDPTGPAEVLSRLPGATITMIAVDRGPVRTDTAQVAVLADRTMDEVESLDVLLVPGAGARGTVTAMNDRVTLDWIRSIHGGTRWTTSVCTGSLVLGAAGLLDRAPATTHWASASELPALGARYLPERYVTHGRIITAAGVSAGLDMALHLAGLLAGEGTARALQLAVEYDPRPPYDAGNAARADPALRERALQVIAGSQG